MAKLKKATLSMNNKEKAFIYEVIGIISLVVSIIAIARFGIIGKYLVLTFCLLFGDWYFIFIILLGFFGIYSLVFHKKIEFKSVRYYGVILILLSLLIITHFNMHEYVNQFEGNNIKMTLNLYFDYFKTNSISSIKGGGIIGCIFFYITYYLLGTFGTILISLIMFFVGIVFLTKKTIREFIETIVNIFKKSILFVKGRFNHVIDNVKEISSDYTKNKKDKQQKNKNTNILKKENETQINRCEELKIIIKNTFSMYNIDVINISYLICEHIVVYFIKVDPYVNFNKMEEAFMHNINENFLIKYDKSNDQFIFEINKIKPSSYSFEKAKKEISKNELNIILGLDDRNMIVELEDNLLVVGKNKNILKKYFSSIIEFCQTQRKFNKNSCIVFDLNNEINYEYKTNDLSVFDEIIKEIDNNLQLLNIHHKISIDEYNKSFKQKIKKKYVFIYNAQMVLKSKKYYDKFLYIIQTGKLAGIFLILFISDNLKLPNAFISAVSTKLLLKNDFDSFNNIISPDYYDIINEEVEGFYKDRDLIIRISLLMKKITD